MEYKKIQIEEDNRVVAKKDIRKPSLCHRLAIRSRSNLATYGYYLTGDSDWIVSKDDEGVLVLVELRKGVIK